MRRWNLTIKEVNEKYNISQDTLRYYEKEGLINPVPRVSGIRNYGKAEIDNIEFIICMRNAGLSVNVLKEYINLIRQGDKTAEKRRELLIEQREIVKKRLEDLNKAYERLNYKIDSYSSVILDNEKKLIKNN